MTSNFKGYFVLRPATYQFYIQFFSDFVQGGKMPFKLKANFSKNPTRKISMYCPKCFLGQLLYYEWSECKISEFWSKSRKICTETILSKVPSVQIFKVVCRIFSGGIPWKTDFFPNGFKRNYVIGGKNF